MTMRFIASTAAATLALCPSAALAAKDPLTLKPISAWQVDYAEDRCRLIRKFGDEENTVFAVFDRYGPGESFRLTLAGEPVRGPRAARSNLSTRIASPEPLLALSVRFGPHEDVQKLVTYNGSFGEHSALIVAESARLGPVSGTGKQPPKEVESAKLAQLAMPARAREKAVRYLEIGRPLSRAVVLETGSMAGPFAALDTCVEDLIGTWGVDIEKHKTLLRPALPSNDPGTWIASEDYPDAMISAGQAALVEFRLNIGADGLPTACYIQSTTRPKEFDDTVCRAVMSRARFDPALDAEGKPIASYYRNSVRFQIPN